MGNLFSSYSKGFPEDLNRVFIEHTEGSIITYRDLLDQSEKYANGFKALGLQAGDRVSIQVSKSPEVVFIYLACLRSNLIFHPLNTAYKEKELSFFLNDAKPSVFICEQEVSDKIASLDIDQLPSNIYTLLPNQKGTIHDIKVPGNHEVQDCPEEQIAALLYSSGTTGKPKGIMLSHGNIGSNAHALKEAWQFTSDDCLLHALPIYHVHGLFVALGCAFLSGSKVFWLDTFNPDAVVNALPNCTVMMGVPTYYTRLLSNEKLNKEVVKNIRIFISGSAPLLEETFDEFYIRTGHEIIERYGMTETNMITSNPYNGERRPGTVGKPLPDVEIQINDSQTGRENADGEIGMIEVRGPNVFKGYWNMPDKTALELKENGFFITGDLGKLSSDGYLSIVGREKDLIISGGYNVYPKEIEDVLNEIEKIDETAVFGISDNDFGERVVAAVVMAENESFDKSETEIFVNDKLARYKQPKEYFVLKSLPRNSMGKVQKNELRKKFSM